jgi:hypothetical protein
MKTKRTLYGILCLLLAACNGCAGELRPARVATHPMEGFVAGTIVKTAIGHRTIESLHPNDYVVSYNSTIGKLQEDRVHHVARHIVNGFFEITADGISVRAGPLHKFYAIRDGHIRWIKAAQLQSGDLLYTSTGSWMPVQHVERIERRALVYTVSTDQCHNFFVSDRDFLVHNFVIELGAIAGCKVLFSITSALIACVVVWIGGKMLGKGRGHAFIFKKPPPDKWRHIFENNLHDHRFPEKDPEKTWDFASKILMAAISRDELQDGIQYKVSGITEYGVLEIVGKVVDGIVRIGTMYIKDSSR